MTECKIKGPYLPVGDVDWECVRHEVNARLKEDAQARINAGYLDPNEVKRSDFYCPVGRIIESLSELGAVSEERVEGIITSVLEEDRLREIQDFHGFVEQLNHEPQSSWAATFDRFYEAGGNHPVVYGGDMNQLPQVVRERMGSKQEHKIQGVRAQYSFIDEAAEIAPLDPKELIGAQVSLQIQTNTTDFVASMNEARIRSDAVAATMRRITPSKRQK